MSSRNGDRTTHQFLESPSRYDLVLAVIPVAFLAAGLASQFLPLSPNAALTAAALVCALAVLDGLFLNPPRTGSRPR